jgi:hypothetical protein
MVVKHQLGQIFGARGAHKIGLQTLYLRRSFVLGKWISKIADTRSEINQELALPHAILQPAPSHVHCLGAFLLDGLVRKTFSRRVVDLHGDSGLIVA